MYVAVSQKYDHSGFHQSTFYTSGSRIQRVIFRVFFEAYLGILSVLEEYFLVVDFNKNDFLDSWRDTGVE